MRRGMRSGATRDFAEDERREPRGVTTLLLTIALLIASAAVTTEARAAPRKPAEPTEVEVVDLSEDVRPDPQGIAAGAQLGGGWYTNRGSRPGVPGLGASITTAFGLGPRGARVPLSLEPWISFMVPLVDGHPNRFTEVGVRVLWRFTGILDGHWLSLGTGLVFTSTRPSAGYSKLCVDNPPQAAAAGADCSESGEITPGWLIDVGLGVKEWTLRGMRVGIGARVPFQVSSHPGLGVLGFFYAQIGTGM